ncbi:RraA family protein [Kaistia defluvii]|uniref:RraA family protein n=1 Tax=Kaistia defluvii TaxID=410841 RepID=UPI0022546607|nr:RraA family protein [Kaistia defluvii]MCX5518349.1 RraA family protein [Kaistia defluvii]
MTSTAPLPEGWNKLYAAVLSDALDAVGVTTQAMPSRIRPLDDTLVLCGRARTGIYMETAHVDPDVNPYELEIKLIDDLKPDDVAILACGGSGRIAPWGSLLSTAAVGRKAAGCITDGFVRDIKTIRDLKLPVFHAGIAPLDSKGRGQIAAIDVPVICAGVRVCTGDLVFGDADGVVVIPQAVEAEVLRIAFDKIASEDSSMDDLRNGAYLRDVYERHGVL